jgi:hypothetical protein
MAKSKELPEIPWIFSKKNRAFFYGVYLFAIGSKKAKVEGKKCHAKTMKSKKSRHVSRVETLPNRDLRAGQSLPGAPGICWHRGARRYRFFSRFRRCRHWDPMPPTSGRNASRVETLPNRDLRAGQPFPGAPGICWHRGAHRYRFFSRFRRCRHWDPMPPTSDREMKTKI